MADLGFIGSDTVALAEVAPPRVYRPQPGRQTFLVACPVTDVLYGGARGGGKTFGLLLDFVQHEALYKGDAQGILFRRTYDELIQVVRDARKVLPLTGAHYRRGDRVWVWPSGAVLSLRYLERYEDAERYQGHSYTWVGVDEAGNYASADVIDLMWGTVRGGREGQIRVLRLTANPGGVGHNWLKARYIDPAPPFTLFTDADDPDHQRVYIPSTIDDNEELTRTTPDYWKNVERAASGNQALLRAWRYGDWDIVAGGMFDDLWRREVHILDPFEIPRSWYRDRSFDWGSAKPFSVGWWAESDGTVAPNGRTYPRGTLFRTAEWYGCNPRKPNDGIKLLAVEIARGIVERERGDTQGKIHDGPADTSIFDAQFGVSVADDMKRAGVRWLPADKRPGSRKIGWERLRHRLKAAHANPGEPIEEPALYVFSNCRDWIRTVPVLPRDRIKTDDVDTKAEDHAADETRYRIMHRRLRRSGGEVDLT